MFKSVIFLFLVLAATSVFASEVPTICKVEINGTVIDWNTDRETMFGTLEPWLVHEIESVRETVTQEFEEHLGNVSIHQNWSEENHDNALKFYDAQMIRLLKFQSAKKCATDFEHARVRSLADSLAGRLRAKLSILAVYILSEEPDI